MKKICLLLMIVTVLACLFGCGGSKEDKPVMVKAPNTAEAFDGCDWMPVYEEFEKAGFTNITTEELKDIDGNVVFEEGAISGITIDGDSEYSIDAEYDSNVEVLITYHSLAEFETNIHINFEGNLLLSKYDVDFNMDELNEGTMEHGEDGDYDLTLTYGKHTITFARTDDSDVKGEVSIDVTSNLEASYSISCKSDKIKVELDYIDYKTEIPEGKVKVTKSATDFYGENYENVVNELKEMGFSNIKSEPLYDIILGITEDGELDSIDIEGNKDFRKGEIFDTDEAVVVKYHTLEENDPNNVKDTEESIDGDNTKKTERDEDTLTVKNCKALKNILSMKEDMAPEYSEFAINHYGDEIEFDARIDYMENHGKYNTRYDILISAGDYDPDHQIGPAFKFEDVNYYDLNTDMEEVSMGMNIHVIAVVEEYDESCGLFYLEPVAITAR